MSQTLLLLRSPGHSLLPRASSLLAAAVILLVGAGAALALEPAPDERGLPGTAPIPKSFPDLGPHLGPGLGPRITPAPKIAPAPNAAPKAKAEEPRDPASVLDRLFARLAEAKDEEEAAGIARQIERRWLNSGSDTADLLLGRAVLALTHNDQPLAIELMDRVVAIRPQWAEGWNKRGTVFYIMGDHQRAAADIQRALSIEPRHFEALNALARIFSANDDDKHALEAYRRALAINPYLSGAKDKVKRLELEVDGRDL